MGKILSSPIGFLVAGLLFAGCSFWIYKNVKLEDLVGDNTVNTKTVNNSSKKEKYEIRNNDIVQAVSPDAVKLIIDGESIEGAVSISNLSVSPDGTRFCFLVHMIVPVWLYVSDVDGKNIKQVDLAKNCLWSPDGRYVAYSNHTTDVSPVDVIIYDTREEKVTNLTKDYGQLGYFRNYSNIKWLSNTEIFASYLEFKQTDVSIQNNGQSLININGLVSDE